MVFQPERTVFTFSVPAPVSAPSLPYDTYQLNPDIVWVLGVDDCASQRYSNPDPRPKPLALAVTPTQPSPSPSPQPQPGEFQRYLLGLFFAHTLAIRPDHVHMVGETSKQLQERRVRARVRVRVRARARAGVGVKVRVRVGARVRARVGVRVRG